MVSTANGLKFTEFKVRYHERRARGRDADVRQPSGRAARRLRRGSPRHRRIGGAGGGGALVSDGVDFVSLDDVRAAQARIAPHVRVTPTVRWKDDLWLKLEMLQMGGSFKARGACNRVFAADATQLEHGVVTASGGNHGLGVAYAATRRGVAGDDLPARARAAVDRAAPRRARRPRRAPRPRLGRRLGARRRRTRAPRARCWCTRSKTPRSSPGRAPSGSSSSSSSAASTPSSSPSAAAGSSAASR